MLVAFNKADFGWVRGRVVAVRRDGGVVVKLVDLETTVAALTGEQFVSGGPSLRHRISLCPWSGCPLAIQKAIKSSGQKATLCFLYLQKRT